MSKLFLYDSTKQNSKSQISVPQLAALGDILAPQKEYIYATGAEEPDEINILSGIIVTVGNSIFKTPGATLTAGDLDIGDSFVMGKDYNVYICDPSLGVDTVDSDEVFKISESNTYPDGYTALTSRRIGGFHYGVVRKVSSVGIPINSSGVEKGSGWEGNVYTGVVPNSVWTLRHRPKCDPAGMVYIGNGLWGDIYLSSDGGNQDLLSVYNAYPITGTENMSWYTLNERAQRSGKRLPTYAEFCQAAFGAPAGQDSSNTNAWAATTNTARCKTGFVTNAVSATNIRDLVGNVWAWLDEFCLDPTATTWAWQDVLKSGQGQAYLPSNTALRALVGGGDWGGGVHAGARAVSGNDHPWGVNPHIGAWCACDSL